MLSSTKQGKILDNKNHISKDVQPLTLTGSALLFGIPTIVFLFATYVFIPFLESRGVPALHSMLAAFTVPLALMFTAALVAYIGVEKREPLGSVFADRMWYPRIQLKDILWGGGIFLVGTLVVGGMAMIERALIGSGIIPLPTNIPLLFNPNVQLSSELLAEAAGGPLTGQWGLVLLYFVYLFFNIAGEELWWRGYILPRQVQQHGDSAWLVHGVMWTLFHAFKWWNLLSVLPLALLMAYVSQRTRSNWPALISHLVGNSIFFIMIILGVAGL